MASENSTIIMNCKSNFQTLVILDLETTGLPFDEPKITELAMVAVSISTLDQLSADEQLPRILNKFVKLFNPNKSIRSKATELSNLNNQMLENCAPFTRETVDAIEAFLNDFPKPICFVAHNGNTFDFPIFYDEIRSACSTTFSNNCATSSDTSIVMTNEHCSVISKDASMQTDFESVLLSIACVDSLPFFRAMSRLLNETDIQQESDDCHSTARNDLNNKTHELSLYTNSETTRRGYVEIPVKSNSIPQGLSMKLAKIYEREFNQISPLKSHHAEDDCLMLLALVKLYLPDWLQWMDNHHRSLSDFSCLPLKSTKPFPLKIDKKIKRPLKF